MSDYKLRFRQIHLDFHTSPEIPGIGEKFDKKQWQDTLKAGHVDSITCFSKCHHGLSYHPTKVGMMHPYLKFDLLRAQYDACKEVDVNVPVYLSAGVDSVVGENHIEWREIMYDGKLGGWESSRIKPGFISMCFNTPYLDYLCRQIEEAVTLFHDCNGIFLDIIRQDQCCCKYCMDYMMKNGLNPAVEEDRIKCSQEALLRYYKHTTAACKINNSEMPVFHNDGHITKGNRDILKYFSHLELESLPTGGWGYDHFPVSAKYTSTLGFDFLGMTGKFHTTWAEFGGFKHPNALRYECAAMLAFGSKCSVGDQLHPNGILDESTYGIIGAAYSEVESKEPWCDNVKSVADIGVLSCEAETGMKNADTGIGRVLLESHFLFDIIDRTEDFNKYKLIILPDYILIDDKLKTMLDSYVAKGGKLLLTGKSGLKKDESGFAFDIGAEYKGESEFQPDYIAPKGNLELSFVKSPVVMYLKSQKIKATDGEILADIYEPYFNRTWDHFCSHQHAPHAKISEYAGGIKKGNIVYLAHPIFRIYELMGAVVYKEYVSNVIKMILGDDITFTSNMPSSARVSLMNQPEQNRQILHLLYANTISRGTKFETSPEGFVLSANKLEVIEELMPLANVDVSLKLSNKPNKITLEPQGKEIDFEYTNGKAKIHLDSFTCHQMVVIS